MFEEGSPKESHKVIVTVGVSAGLIMVVAAYWARVAFWATGRYVELDLGAMWAMGMGVIIVVLLLAWQRGIFEGNWPLAASLIAAALGFLMLGGDWTQGRGRDTEVVVTPSVYITLAAALVAAITCAVGLLRPVIERSEAHGQWRSRRESDE